MSQKEMIEKMEKNDKGWMFLSPKEQTFMRKANQQGKVICLRFGGGWSDLGGWDCLGDGANLIWRLESHCT